MFKNKYLIRLDDACPTMDREKWDKIESLLDKYDVKPMVGIVPNCRDENLMVESPDPGFWEKARIWQEKGWAIALHGYDHCYISDKGLNGLNPFWKRSEFAGVPLEIQKQKIREGLSILKGKGLNVKYFFAPSHTFDENTLEALRTESDIRIISDTIATKPYRVDDFVFLPQLGGHCSEMKIPGTWTFCLHPNMMTEDNFAQTEDFLRKNKSKFLSFNHIDLSSVKNKDCFSSLLSWLYFKQRSIRGIQ